MNANDQTKRRVITAVTIVVGVVGLVTLLWPTWIETLTGADPDGGDGSFELWLARGLAFAALVGVLAMTVVRRRHRSARHHVQEAHGHG
jgi:hypothetical protein